MVCVASPQGAAGGSHSVQCSKIVGFGRQICPDMSCKNELVMVLRTRPGSTL